MNHRTALGALHIGALFFGLTGVVRQLAAASPSIIVFGRAAFAVLALALFASLAPGWQRVAGATCAACCSAVCCCALGQLLHRRQSRRRSHRHPRLRQLPGLHGDPRRPAVP
jgi:membrane protein implicated in regulation of membrane protease activity